MAIKEVRDIRLNGKSWRNCNGKELNSLTINGTTYKLIKNYYTIRFNNINGNGTGYYDVVQIPEGSNVTFGYNPGGTSIIVYVNSSVHDVIPLTPSTYKVFMSLDTSSISSINRDYSIECKWSTAIGEIELGVKIYYQEGQEENGICTIEIGISSSDHLGGVVDTSELSLTDEDNRLNKRGNTWVTETIPVTDFLRVRFSYHQGAAQGYYSVFIGNIAYSGISERLYDIEALPPQDYKVTLKIVDNGYI